MVISVYLSLLPVAHLSDASRRRLVVTADSARIQDGTAESSAWFFNALGVKHRHTGLRFNVSSERLLIIFKLASRELEPTTCTDPKHCVYESYALPTELIGRLRRKETKKNPKIRVFQIEKWRKLCNLSLKGLNTLWTEEECYVPVLF